MRRPYAAPTSPVPPKLVAVVLLLTLACSTGLTTGTAEAWGQGREGAEKLWKEFPLDEGAETPAARENATGRSASAATPTPTTSAIESNDDAGVLAIALLTALAIVLIGLAAMYGLRRRGRGEPAADDRRQDRGAADPSQAGAKPPVGPLFSGRHAGGRPAENGTVERGLPTVARADAAYPPAGTTMLAYVSDVAPLGGESKPPASAEQEMAIREECRRRGWRLIEVVSEDTATKDRGLKRDALQALLERLEAGEASGLVVDRLDRVASSAAGLGSLMRRVADANAVLVSLDFELSTASPSGKLLVKVLSGIAGWETEPGARAVPDALMPFRNRSSGTLATWEESSLRARIREMRTAGMTLQAIADALNDEGVPTLRGAKAWRVSSVQSAAGYKRPSAGSKRLAR